MSTVFDNITVSFDTIAYPFTNIILGAVLFGTKTTRIVKRAGPVLTRVKMPVAPIMSRVAQPVAPTYTRVR
jgi:hypothetical protein